MRALILIALTVVASVFVISAVRHDPGFIVIGYQNWSVELSLALGLLFILTGFFLIYFVIRILVHTVRFPADLRSWRQRRRTKNANRLLTEGFMALSEGHWTLAEKKLTRSAQDCPTPMIPFMAAATAAQEQGDDESRDFYLQRAEQASPTGKLAVGLKQAGYQLDQRQLDQALETLTGLRKVAPKNVLVLKLLVDLHKSANDWGALEALLPELKRRHALSDMEWHKLEKEVHVERLRRRQHDAEGIQAAWNTASKPLRHDPDFTHEYVKLLHEAGADPVADKAIRETLRFHWDDRLVDCFGKLEPDDPAQQLAQAELWLKGREKNPILLLTLGRLSRRNRLWGKARSYMEASIGIYPHAESYQELGELLEQLNEHESASEQFAAGLKLAVSDIKEKAWQTSAPQLPAPEKPAALHSPERSEEKESTGGLVPATQAALSGP